MAKKNAGKAKAAPVAVYRYKAKRKNNPPAGLAAQGKVAEAPKLSFAYNPHLPPVLRFDPDAKPDKLPELLRNARKRPLTVEEARVLVEALRSQEPWLEWAGKREKKGFEVEPVALHMRLDSQQAEIAATVLFAARSTGGAGHDKPTERQVFDEVMKWKQRRRPPLNEQEVASTIRNLAALGWLDVKASEDLPLPEENLAHM